MDCSPSGSSVHGLYHWNSPGNNNGVDSHSHLQGIFLTKYPALHADSLPSEPPEKPLFNPSNLEKSPFARLAGLCRITCVLSHSVISDSLQPHGLWPTRLLCPWGFSRQEHSSGLPCPSPGDLPKPGTEPGSPALEADI